jgi:hypothetical protein
LALMFIVTQPPSAMDSPSDARQRSRDRKAQSYSPSQLVQRRAAWSALPRPPCLAACLQRPLQARIVLTILVRRPRLGPRPLYICHALVKGRIRIRTTLSASLSPDSRARTQLDLSPPCFGGGLILDVSMGLNLSPTFAPIWRRSSPTPVKNPVINSATIAPTASSNAGPPNFRT